MDLPWDQISEFVWFDFAEYYRVLIALFANQPRTAAATAAANARKLRKFVKVTRWASIVTVYYRLLIAL